MRLKMLFTLLTLMMAIASFSCSGKELNQRMINGAVSIMKDANYILFAKQNNRVFRIGGHSILKKVVGANVDTTFVVVDRITGQKRVVASLSGKSVSDASFYQRFWDQICKSCIRGVHTRWNTFKKS